jgi:hypothetical protein
MYAFHPKVASIAVTREATSVPCANRQALPIVSTRPHPALAPASPMELPPLSGLIVPFVLVAFHTASESTNNSRNLGG